MPGIHCHLPRQSSLTTPMLVWELRLLLAITKSRPAEAKIQIRDRRILARLVGFQYKRPATFRCSISRPMSKWSYTQKDPCSQQAALGANARNRWTPKNAPAGHSNSDAYSRPSKLSLQRQTIHQQLPKIIRDVGLGTTEIRKCQNNPREDNGSSLIIYSRKAKQVTREKGCHIERNQ